MSDYDDYDELVDDYDYDNEYEEYVDEDEVLDSDFEFEPEKIYKQTQGGDEENKDVNENVDEDENEENENEEEEIISEEETINNIESEINKVKPMYRRPMCSKYEYARLLTMLAKAMFNSNSLKEFIEIDEQTGSSMIDYTEVAYKLIKSGKWDAQLDNGYDVANLSELKINPIWEEQIEIYLREHHDSMNRELF